MSDDLGELARFLVEAKRRTYAGLDDDASVAAPLLPGSKQLEHRVGRYAYRDIYFGMGFFVGQETVARDDRVIWSMSYSGGTLPDLADGVSLPSIYKFLRQSLLAVDASMPYRGPATMTDGAFTYRNSVTGTLARFCGDEQIRHRGTPVYALRYSGGLLR